MAGGVGLFWMRKGVYQDDKEDNNLLRTLLESSMEQDMEDKRFLEMMESYIFDDVDRPITSILGECPLFPILGVDPLYFDPPFTLHSGFGLEPS